jgi:hypothetical protein
MINKIIRNFLAKQAAGRSDDGIMITLREPQKIQVLENIMADLLMRNGIDPRAITSEAQLKTIINQIEAASKQTIQSGIRNAESAKIFEIATGKEIPKGSKIMGGQAVDDLPPPGSRGGPDDIAAPVQSSEETLKNMIMAENKKNIDKIKQRQTMLNEAIDDASPGFADDIKYDAEIVAENLAERMGLSYDDMPTKQRLKLYDEAYTGLSKQRSKNRKKPSDADDQESSYDDGPADFDPDADNETFAIGGRVGLKVGTGKKFLQKVFGKEKFQEMKSRDPEMYIGLLEIANMYRKRDKEGLKMYLQKFLPHMDDTQIEEFIRGSDGTEGLLGELIRLGSGRDYAGKLEMIKRSENMRKLDNLEVTEDMIRKPNADGGIMRLGFKDGMNRRTFLKLLGGFASIPIVGKIFKPLKVGKTVSKVPIIKTADVPGKPEWFDQLVNKVILEGDDVTKRFATQERQVVHMKKIDDETSVMVTQDLNDGSIMVDVDDPVRNVMGESGQDTSVQMMLKKGQADETTKGTPADEFSFTENDMRNYMDGPDDYTTEFTENTVNKMSDLTSDLGKIKSYATGKGPTMKQIVESKKRKDKVAFAERNPSEYASERGPDIDYSDYDDFASGGIAGMLGE